MQQPNKILDRRHVSELVKSGGYLRSLEPETFWPCVREQLTWHEQERFSVLRKVQSDQGRGRAWLRAALNERSLERHLHSIISPEAVQPYYEDWAFLFDQEKSSMLPDIAAGMRPYSAPATPPQNIRPSLHLSFLFTSPRPYDHTFRHSNR
jgi:hypothetical protein